MRVKVGEFDVREPRPMWGLRGYQLARILVRDGTRPVGWMSLTVCEHMDAFDRGFLLRCARAQLGPAEVFESEEDFAKPPISVVVCTRDRHIGLRQCIGSLLELRYPEFEVIVVDNASRGTETRAVARESGVRYEREEESGLDPARNCGWRAANHGIVAYTDDDARVDPHWLTGIARGFADAKTSCVTGLICPSELETPAQSEFENYGGMGKGFRPKVFEGRLLAPEESIAAHNVGVGANMAFRRGVLERTGGFDPHLDVGTPANGAGDLDMFHRLLISGHVVRYEPSAIVWHQHRRSMHGLYRQVYNNGRSFGCYLLKRWSDNELSRRAVAEFALRRWIGGWILGSVLDRRPGRTLPLIAAEFIGALHAPWAYAKTYGLL